MKSIKIQPEENCEGFWLVYDDVKLNEIKKGVIKFKDWVSAFDYFFLGCENIAIGEVPIPFEDSKAVVMQMIADSNWYIPEYFVYYYFDRTEEEQANMKLASFAYEMQRCYNSGSTISNFCKELLVAELVKD